LLLIPWAVALFHAASRRLASGQRAFFYIPKPTFDSVASFYGALCGSLQEPHTLTASLLLFAIPVGTCIAALRRTDSRSAARAGISALLLFATFPVLVAFFVSMVSTGTAVWGQRHLIIAAAPFFLLVTTGLTHISHSGVRRVVTVAILAWSTVAGWEFLSTPYKRTAWDLLAAQLVRAEDDHAGLVTVYTSNENAALPLQYYLHRLKADRFQVVVRQDDTLVNQRIFKGPGPRPYWAVDIPVVLQADDRWPQCPHCWIAVVDSSDTARLDDSGLLVGTGFSELLVSRRWNRSVVSLRPVWSQKPLVPESSLTPAVHRPGSVNETAVAGSFPPASRPATRTSP
jgi:hypothetical protein